MRGSRTGSTAALLACLLGVGCSRGADPAPQDPATSAAAPSATPAGSEDAPPSPGAAGREDTAARSTGSGESEPAPASPSASPATGSDGPAATQTLAIEQRHPNGSVLRVTSLTVEPNAITVGIEVVNGLGTTLSLARGGAIVTLTDDLGGVYEFIEPEDNPDLDIEARGTLTGELVYFGVLQPEATTLRLQTSVSMFDDATATVYDPATEAANAASPHFSVEIPLGP